MAETSGKRLSRAQRREQLLEVALEIVRAEGTDALTLGYLAERAGVSKPVPYEHFRTRSGLLIALFKQIDDQHVAVLLGVLDRAPRRLPEVARVASAAYMNCYLSVGPEWHALSGALEGDEEMETFKHQLLDSYVARFRDIFAPYCDLSKRELDQRCVAIVGAAEALSRDMLRDRIDEKSAAATLTSLVISWLAKGR
jgi:AcrR family transcriptional regulator